MDEIQSLCVPVRVLILAEGKHQVAQFGEKSSVWCGGEPTWPGREVRLWLLVHVQLSFWLGLRGRGVWKMMQGKFVLG